MKKILLSMMVGGIMILSPQKAQAQWAVTDVGATSQLIGLLVSAGEQITTLSSILQVLDDTKEARQFVSGAVVSLSEINKLSNISASVVNDVQFMLNFLSKNDGKTITPKQALKYSQVCINSMDNVIRLMKNAADIVTDLLLDASDAERVDMIGKISSSMEAEAVDLSRSKQQLQKNIARRANFNVMLKSQGVRYGY